MRTSRRTIDVIAATSLFASTALALAQELPRVEVIKTRVANLHKLGDAFKHIRDELRAEDPSMALIRDSAGQIESLGSQILMWFPPGTGPVNQPEAAADSEGKTRAKAEVWTDWPTFELTQKKFHIEAQKMRDVAQSDDKAAIAAQFKILGDTCKSCHHRFRE